MYSSVVLHILTLLSNRSPELLHLPQLELCPIKQHLIAPSPLALAAAILPSVSLDLTTLDASGKRAPAACLFVTGLVHSAWRPQGFSAQ